MRREAKTDGFFLRLPAMVACGLAVLCLAAAGAAASEITATKGQLKAAYIYNLFQFTEWPAGSKPADRWRVCYLPGEPDAAAFDALAGQSVAGRTIEVRESADPAVLGSCHILHLPGQTMQLSAEQIEKLNRQAVLTIIEGEKLEDPKPVMFFYRDREHLRMGINYPQLKQSGIRIGSRLLRMLKVRGFEPQQESP